LTYAARFQRMPSSVIRNVDYNDTTRRLEIEFVTGRRYIYLDVPPAIVAAMRNASSKGRYFNRRIRDHFNFQRRQ